MHYEIASIALINSQWVGSAISQDLSKKFTIQIKPRFAFFEVSGVIKSQKNWP